MSIQLLGHPSALGEGLILNDIEFIDDDGFRFFRLSNSEGYEILVNYIPKYVSDWDPERYEVHIFENAYLNAEDDVFELYEKTVSKRFGWIFPITVLDSNDSSYVDYKTFKHIRWVAYNRLLQETIKLDYQNTKQDYRISDFYKNTSICILSKDEIARVPGFRIENYILSFLRYDYLLFHQRNKGVTVFDKRLAIDALREDKHEIHIEKSNFDITENPYTKSLFLEHLYQSQDFLVRYVFLYQILEHFIQEESDKIFMKLIDKYQRGAISKNDLREQVSKFQNDRNLLKEVFKQSSVPAELRAKYLENCQFLYSDIEQECKEVFEDVVYDFRNLVTHNYRALLHKTTEVKEIIRLFELVVLELLINYKIEPVKSTPEILSYNPATQDGGDEDMGCPELWTWIRFPRGKQK